MPIYEYACHACGLEKEHLQKMSDALIANCPACGSSDYVKKVSAAGFQLKGTGWYVTDFRNKNAGKSGSRTGGESGKDTAGSEKSTASTAADTSTAAAPASAAASSASPTSSAD